MITKRVLRRFPALASVDEDWTPSPQIHTDKELKERMAPNEAEEKEETKEEVVVAAEETTAGDTEIIAEEEGAITEHTENDIISGRGAAVNLNKGNRTFRDLCFKRKPEFDAASHAAKRRIASEIVAATKATNGRFLKRKESKGPWYEMDDEKALLKACQVMRDYQRPDRMAIRQSSGNGRKRRYGDVEQAPPVAPAEPVAPIVENPYGVHDNDVLSGRGAFVNGHVGNKAFRELCLDRKTAFDAGNYSEKRSLATEVYNQIKNLDPPGRFLKRAAKADGDDTTETVEGEWVELNEDKAIHKACQVMRDIARPDRVDGRRRKSRAKKDGKDSMALLGQAAVAEAVAETEVALDQALDTVPKKDEETTEVQV